MAEENNCIVVILSLHNTFYIPLTKYTIGHESTLEKMGFDLLLCHLNIIRM